MSTDRELLELAAKAAGIAVIRSRLEDLACRDFLIENSFRNPHQKAGQWNPITDDGDALRLAVKIGFADGKGLAIFFADSDDPTVVVRKEGEQQALELVEIDPFAATRRAIVRAAAEIGKSK